MSQPARVKRTEPIPSREGRRAHPKPSGQWCKGRVGVPHRWKWVEDEERWRHTRQRKGSTVVMSEQRCERCGKRGGHLRSWLAQGEGTGWNPIRRAYDPLQGPAFGGPAWVKE